MKSDSPFTQVALETRTLVELPFQRPIVPRMNLEKPVTEEHLSWMLLRAVHFFDAGRTEQAHLWLGYVQGVLAMRGITLPELDLVNQHLEKFSPYRDGK